MASLFFNLLLRPLDHRALSTLRQVKTMSCLVHIHAVSSVNSQSLTFSPLYMFGTQILCILKMLDQHFMSLLHLSREILVLIVENPHAQLLLKLKKTVEIA